MEQQDVSGGSWSTTQMVNVLLCRVSNQEHINFVHSCQQKSIDLKFSKSQTGSDVRYSCHHNSCLLFSPYLRIRGVSLSSIHYNQSHRVYEYMNRRQQYIFNLKLKR